MQAPTTSYDEVKSIILEEHGKPIEELFEDFDETPLASASLG